MTRASPRNNIIEMDDVHENQLAEDLNNFKVTEILNYIYIIFIWEGRGHEIEKR